MDVPVWIYGDALGFSFTHFYRLLPSLADLATAVLVYVALGRRGASERIRLGGGVTFRRLSPVPTLGVEFFESTYPPGSMSNAHGELLRHEGYEVGTVTAGELTVDFDTDVVTLGAGDSITYPCSRSHLISNRSASVTAVATWLIVNA